MAQPVLITFGRGDRRASRVQCLDRVPPRAPSRRCGITERPRNPNASSNAAWLAGSAKPICSCWPCTSTSSEDARRSSATPTGWSLMNARVRPSLASTRRSTTSPSASRPCSESSGVSGCPAGGAKQAVTLAWSAPARTNPASALAPSARPRLSSRIDLPAPVSPVSTVSPGPNDKVQSLDQHDVANGESGEHAAAPAAAVQKIDCQARAKKPRSSGLRGGPGCCTRPLSNRSL